MITVEQILGLARDYVTALDARRYSHATRALTDMANAIRSLPKWMMPSVVEPAAAVERKLECGTTLRMTNEDGHLVIVVVDDETAMAPVLTAKEGEQTRADIARVLAAIGCAR